MAPEFVTELLGNTQTFITLRVLQNKYMRLHEDPPVTNAVRFLQMLCTCVWPAAFPIVKGLCAILDRLSRAARMRGVWGMSRVTDRPCG